MMASQRLLRVAVLCSPRSRPIVRSPLRRRGAGSTRQPVACQASCWMLLQAVCVCLACALAARNSTSSGEIVNGRRPTQRGPRRGADVALAAATERFAQLISYIRGIHRFGAIQARSQPAEHEQPSSHSAQQAGHLPRRAPPRFSRSPASGRAHPRRARRSTARRRPRDGAATIPDRARRLRCAAHRRAGALRGDRLGQTVVLAV